jgi:nitrogen fixation protein NifU and related proteins
VGSSVDTGHLALQASGASLGREAAIEVLLDRYEQPARRGRLPAPALSATATNPRCGDVVTMFADVQGEVVARVSFEGAGCTISLAAADLVAELAEGQSLEAVARLRPHDVLDPSLVRTRIDCASLALRTLQQAIG